LEEIVSSAGQTIAIVIKKDFNKAGANFVSKNDYPIQLGINSYKMGQTIKNHLHKKRKVVISDIQEVIYFKNGEALVSLFEENKKFVKSLRLSAGDLIFFVSGGHGFEISKDTVLIEVKQGPYFGRDLDKVIIE
jgi:hypothetical protein